MPDSAPSLTPTRRLTALWAIGLSVQACIWASSYPAIDWIVTPDHGQGLTIIQLAFWRAAIATIVFLPITFWFWRQHQTMPWRAVTINFGLGAVLALAITLWGWGVAYGSLVINGFLNALFPVFVTLLSIRFGDRVHPKAWGWIVVAIVGTLLLLLGQAGIASTPDSAGHRYGLLPYGAMLCSLVIISLHTLLARGNADRYPVLLVSAVQMLGSAVTSLILIGLFREPLLPVVPLSSQLWITIVYLAVVVNVFSTWYWLLATTRVPAYQVTVYTYLEPLFVVLITALLGYPPETGLFTWGGGLLILVGAWMVSRLEELPPTDPLPDTPI